MWAYKVRFLDGAPDAATVTDPHPSQPSRPENGLGTAGMVLGILALCLFFVPGLNFVLGLLATVFGGVGYKKVVDGAATNKGVAVTGLTTGIISLIATTAWWIFFLAAIGSAATTSST